MFSEWEVPLFKCTPSCTGFPSGIEGRQGRTEPFRPTDHDALSKCRMNLSSFFRSPCNGLGIVFLSIVKSSGLNVLMLRLNPMKLPRNNAERIGSLQIALVVVKWIRKRREKMEMGKLKPRGKSARSWSTIRRESPIARARGPAFESPLLGDALTVERSAQDAIMTVVRANSTLPSAPAAGPRVLAANATDTISRELSETARPERPQTEEPPS